MQWYWWVLIGWGVSGLLALWMEFRDEPAMRLNVGLNDVWPVCFGPVWLMIKLGQWVTAPRTR